MFAFLTTASVLFFVTMIVKISLTHAENIERIRHGYPPIDLKSSSYRIIGENEQVNENKLQ